LIAVNNDIIIMNEARYTHTVSQEV